MPTAPPRRILPSTASLRAFDAVARHGTCSAAATELYLTVGAVSKQLRALEDAVGVPLFVRASHGLLLNAAGRAYRDAVLPVLGQLAAATSRALTAHAGRRTLMLRVYPAIAERWLLPRFPAFAERHPDIDVQFTTYLSSDRREAATDCALRFGDGVWAGCRADWLLGREVVLAASPALVARHGPPRAPADVLDWPLLLHVEVPDAWKALKRTLRLRAPFTGRTVRYDYYSVLIRAAVSGLGLALIPRFMVADELQSGVLVNPLGLGYRSRAGYWLVYPVQQQGEPALESFRTWLMREAAATEPAAD